MTMGTVVPQYVELRYPDGKLAAKYDPIRGILELQRQGVKFYFDLALLSMPAIEMPKEVCYNFDG